VAEQQICVFLVQAYPSHNSHKDQSCRKGKKDEKDDRDFSAPRTGDDDLSFHVVLPAFLSAHDPSGLTATAILVTPAVLTPSMRSITFPCPTALSA